MVKIFLVFRSISFNSVFVHSIIPAPYLIIETALAFIACTVFPLLRLDLRIILSLRKYSLLTISLISLLFSLSLCSTPRYLYASFKKLETWLNGNKLSLNVAKTHSMLISTKQKGSSLTSRNEALELKIRENELEVVQKTKYLGVQIDCNLDWKEQIKAVSTKVSRAIGFLKHAKSFLPMASLKTLYTGIVEPHFRYCCSVWGCAGSTDINQLQKLQNRAARIITNSSFDTPSRPLITELGWKTVEELIGNESKTMVFKSLNDLAPQYLCNLFTKNSACSSRILRNTETDLRLPKKRSANGQKCFSFRGAKLWNSLPAESKTASSLGSFKKSIQG